MSLKTNRFSGEELKIPLQRLPIPNYLRPLRPIERLLAQDFPPLSPLFCYTKSGKVFQLSARQFISDLRPCLSSDEEFTSFSTHSFRRGDTTFAIDHGVDISAVKAQRNWRSNCYNRYVDNKPALKKTFAATVAQSVAIRRSEPLPPFSVQPRPPSWSYKSALTGSLAAQDCSTNKVRTPFLKALALL